MSQNAGRPRKEKYYVQIKNADSTAIFLDVSSQLGKKLEISKPLATTLMRVREDVVLFSVLKMYGRALEKLRSEPLNFKPGPLARLERAAKASVEEPLPTDKVRVLLNEDTYDLDLKRDQNGVSTLDFPVDVADVVMELPRSPLQMTLFLTSPRTGRLLVVGWQGYPGKPGDGATVSQVASQALHHLVGLAEFQLLSGIASVKIPAPPGRFQIVAPTRKASDRVEFYVPVRLWTADPSEGSIGQGQVKVNVDLDTANAGATGDASKLLFHTEPDAELGAAYEPYRPVLNRGLAAAFSAHFPEDELLDLACNIALSEVSQGDLGRLRDCGATVTGFELNPTTFMPAAAAPVTA